jgi:uncharacterized membrane protein
MVILVLAPVMLEGTRLAGLVPVLMRAYSPFCHQDPARSFHVFGVQLLACSRCTALFAGALSALLAAPLVGLVDKQTPVPRWVLAAGLAPLAADAIAGMAGVWTSTFVSRASTGLVAGALAALFVLPAFTQAIWEIRDACLPRTWGRPEEEVGTCHRE